MLDMYSTLWKMIKSDLFALPEARGAALALQQSIQYMTWCLCLLLHREQLNGAPRVWAEKIYFGHKILMKQPHDVGRQESRKSPMSG